MTDYEKGYVSIEKHKFVEGAPYWGKATITLNLGWLYLQISNSREEEWLEYYFGRFDAVADMAIANRMEGYVQI